MDTFILTITEQNRILTLSSDTTALGSQYDNRAQKLVFVRPEERLSDSLLLYFETQSQDLAPVNIGQENEFVILNTLTQGTGLKLQVAFARDNRLEHSNGISFTLRPSLKRVEAPIEPWPNPASELTKKGFAGVQYMDSVLSFQNLEGDEVASVVVEGGGGGTSTVAWLPEVSAGGELSWRRSSTTTTPETRNIIGPAGPQGAQGPQGATGAQGNPTSVNGKTGINITLTAADVGAATAADIATRAAKTVAVSATLTSAGWTGSAAPFAQTVSVSGMAAGANWGFDIASAATSAQAKAFGGGFIRAVSDAAGTATFWAECEKPTVNIPISIVIWG